MKYAFNNNGVLQDVVMTHPSLIFAEGYASRFIEVPDQCENGWTFDGINFAPPLMDAEEQLALFVRTRRNEMLAASDWTQVADAVVDQTAWAAYRQALRDISSQEGFPWTINWPKEPE